MLVASLPSMGRVSGIQNHSWKREMGKSKTAPRVLSMAPMLFINSRDLMSMS